MEAGGNKQKPPPNPKPYHLKKGTSFTTPRPPSQPYSNASSYSNYNPSLEDSYLSMDGVGVPPSSYPPPPLMSTSTSLRHNLPHSPPPPPPPPPPNNSPPPELPPRDIIRPTSNGVTFQFYLDANSKNLPVEVAIDTGYYGNNRKSSLYEEQLMLNFEMKLHVVRGKVDHGATYHIPLASSLQFSLLHNPSDNLQQAMLGHYFETVGHILAQPSRSRPTAVCVTHTFTGSNPESSICEGDILLISPRVHTRTFKQGKFMKCLDVESGEVKMLHENCVGGFTTQPERIRMSLKDFWGHKYCPPPLKVVLTHSLPQVVLPQNVLVTLLADEWEESVIATHQEEPDQVTHSVSANPSRTVCILKDIGILVRELEKEENKDKGYVQTLIQETCQLYNEFDLVDIDQHLFPDDPVWPNFEEVQSMFYKSVMKDCSQDYTLKRPENAFKQFKRTKSVKNSPSVARRRISSVENINAVANGSGSGSGLKNDYAPVALKSPTGEGVYGIVNDPQSVPGHEAYPVVHDGTEVIPDVAHLLHEVNTANRQMMIHVEGLRAEIEGLKQDLRQTKSIVGSMKREVFNMIGQLESDVTMLKENIGEYVSVVKTGAATIEVENREILRDFSSDQVLQALDLLSLSQHKAAFASKRVTGLELVQYNETVLSQDLGMTSQSDRIRMMLFIEGRDAVWKLLESQGPTQSK